MKKNKSNHIPASRDELIAYIKETYPFYRFADMRGHSDKQLKDVIERNNEKQRKQNPMPCCGNDISAFHRNK